MSSIGPVGPQNRVVPTDSAINSSHQETDSNHQEERVAATQHAIDLARAVAAAAEDKLASKIVAIDVSEQLALTDIFVLASAPNDRQVSAIVDGVEDRLRELGVKPVRREGERDGRWVLIDFSDIVVHVQHEEERAYYQLERLWKDCPSIDLSL
jgi:ribosome-associated protein